jgi:hypothetical protein
MAGTSPAMTKKWMQSSLPPRSIIEETRDLMLSTDINKLRCFGLAAFHRITAAGVEGAA